MADLHAFLDSLKTPWFLLDARVEYYQKVIFKSQRYNPNLIKKLGSLCNVTIIRYIDQKIKVKYT